MWNPFSGFVETWRSLFNPSVRQAFTLNLDGSGLLIDGHFREAQALFARALAINESLYGPSHPEVATSLNNLGLALDCLGEKARAKPLFERALAINEAAYGPSHPKVADTLNNLGRVTHELGDIPQAQALLERALAINEAFYSTEQLGVATSLRFLGDVLEAKGELDQARNHYERALAITERAYDAEDTFPVAVLSEKLGGVLQKLGDGTRAQVMLTRAAELKEKEAEANRIYEVQNLGRVEPQGKALSYTLH